MYHPAGANQRAPSSLSHWQPQVPSVHGAHQFAQAQTSVHAGSAYAASATVNPTITPVGSAGSSFGSAGGGVVAAPTHNVQMSNAPQQSAAYNAVSRRQQPEQYRGAFHTANNVANGRTASTVHVVAGTKVECEDQQCAEEECDAEECGDENRPPRDDNFVCGVDKRPLLPVLLCTSTIGGAVCMFLLQLPLLQQLFDSIILLHIMFLVLYVGTIGCMLYCSMCDPGQLKRDDQRKAGASLLEEAGAASGNNTVEVEKRGLLDGKDDDIASQDSTQVVGPPLPKRCQKTWLYALPIRRYDHYCRWLTNCIGILNHREFVLLLVGLVSIGMLGSILDVALIICVGRQGSNWMVGLFLIMHLMYSAVIVALAFPILRLHIGFISRNELASEWKRNDFYVVESARRGGGKVSVNDLSDDEFNERFDSFQYDTDSNTFDRGQSKNCWNFWCAPRWTSVKKGDRRILGEF